MKINELNAASAVASSHNNRESDPLKKRELLLNLKLTSIYIYLFINH